MEAYIVIACAPQVGCKEEEKARFWNELDDIVENLPEDERLLIGADLMNMLASVTKEMKKW